MTRTWGWNRPTGGPVNTVFQSYALFPHMNVSENVGFGLLMQKVDGAEIEKRVKRALDMVQLSGSLGRQAQRAFWWYGAASSPGTGVGK